MNRGLKYFRKQTKSPDMTATVIPQRATRKQSQIRSRSFWIHWTSSSMNLTNLDESLAPTRLNNVYRYNEICRSLVAARTLQNLFPPTFPNHSHISASHHGLLLIYPRNFHHYQKFAIQPWKLVPSSIKESLQVATLISATKDWNGWVMHTSTSHPHYLFHKHFQLWRPGNVPRCGKG